MMTLIAIISLASVLYLAIGYLVLVAYILWGDTEDIMPVLIVALWPLALLLTGLGYLIAGPKQLANYIDSLLTLGEDWPGVLLVMGICILIATLLLLGAILIW